jgi:acyl-CoA carboxylase subunit beta
MRGLRMGVLGSRLDPGSDAYRANRAANLELLAELDRLLAQARAGGGQEYVDRHRARGKLLARERIELLLDRDGPFLELSPLAAWGSDFPVGASGVTGVGPVAGVECVVTASDPTVRGGATNPFGLRKTLRAMEIAERNRLPLVQLIESGGADLPTQSQIFIPGGTVQEPATSRLTVSSAGSWTVESRSTVICNHQGRHQPPTPARRICSVSRSSWRTCRRLTGAGAVPASWRRHLRGCAC